MTIRIGVLITFLALMFSCNTEKKQKPDLNIKEVTVLSENEIIEGFDLDHELSISPMMDVPSSLYVKEDKGQYSVLYIPKTKEVLEKYQDFDKKYNIQLSGNQDEAGAYSEESLKKINQIIRKDMAIQDYYVIGRYIPNYYLHKDTTFVITQYNVNIPCEMQIYKLVGDKWEFIESARILDLAGLGKYETLSTYTDLLNIK